MLIKDERAYAVDLDHLLSKSREHQRNCYQRICPAMQAIVAERKTVHGHTSMSSFPSWPRKWRA